MSTHRSATKPSLSLDHVGAVVADLDDGAAEWARLGFNLTNRGRELSRTGAPGQRLRATANQLAVFRHGYLELIGATDCMAPGPRSGAIARHDGHHIVALRCEDADRAYIALRRKAEGLSPPIDRSGKIGTPSGSKTVRFRDIVSRDDVYTEGRFIVTEHKTPELLTGR
jgi:Glyoxalase-like domain